MFYKFKKMSVKELADELERQEPLLQDYTRDSRTLEVLAPETSKEILLQIPPSEEQEGGSFPLNEWAHSQMADRMGIPKKYYDKMMDAGHNTLLADNINTWLQPSEENRFIRVIDGKVRAILSDRYKPIDNVNILRCTMEKLLDFRTLEPVFHECQMGITKMYLKIALRGLTGEVRPGDKSHFGIVITNSEVGAASLKVEPYMQRLVCTNGMIRKSLLRKIHVGVANAPDIIQTPATRLLKDAAMYSEFQDAIETCLQRDHFDKWIDELQGTTEVPIAEPTDAVNNLVSKYKITEENKKLIEDFFFKEEDCTQYGLIQGLTRAAQELSDIDEAVRWEAIAGDISEMNEKQFARVVA